MTKRKRTAARQYRLFGSKGKPKNGARRLQEELAKTRAAKVKADLDEHIRELAETAAAAKAETARVAKAKSDEEYRVRVAEVKRLNDLAEAKAKKLPTLWEQFLTTIGW